MPASRSVAYRRKKNGSWRAYTAERPVRVVRDQDDRIVQCPSRDALRATLETQVWFWMSYGGLRPFVAHARARATWERLAAEAAARRDGGAVYRHSDRGIYDFEPDGPHPCPYCARTDHHGHRVRADGGAEPAFSL